MELVEVICHIFRLHLTGKIFSGRLNLKESWRNGRSAAFHAHQCIKWHCHLLLNQFHLVPPQLTAPDRSGHDSSPTRKPCHYVKHFPFDQVPASYCGLYSRYWSWCIIKNVQSCGMPLMYIVIYPEYVTRTKAIVHCCIFSVLSGLRYRWDIVWY